jgi:hypothetical protein
MCPCNSLHMHAVRGTFRHHRQSNGCQSWAECYPFPPLDVTQVLLSVLLARTSTKFARSCAVLVEKLYLYVVVKPFNGWGSGRYIIARCEVLMSVLVRIQVSRYIVSRKTRRYIASSSSETRQARDLGSLNGSCTTRDKPRVTCSYKRLSTHSRLNPNYFKHVYTELQNSLGKKIRQGCTFLKD